jgi:hypothetical protein
VASPPPAGGGKSPDDGTCGFWVGTLWQRVETRRTRTEAQLRKAVRTVYAARFRETARWGPGTIGLGSRQIEATTVALVLDEGAVREHVRGTLSGPGGNRVMGSGAGRFGDQTGGGTLTTEEPSGPTYYEVGLRATEFTYRVTVRWNRGPTEQSDSHVLNIEVGKGDDPGRPRRMDRGSRVMKEEYTVTTPETDYIVGRTVAWDLRRITARCDAPPAVPPLPAESDASDDASTDEAKP